MTRTEDRLTDALAARAAAVREESLRPLVPGEQGCLGAARAGSSRERRGWRARLAPLAAAAAMLMVIGGTIFAVRELPGATSAPFADIGTAHTPPPYYVDLDDNHFLLVRATSTGLLTERLPAPDPWDGASTRLETALAAAANGRTFVVIYNNRGTGIGPYHTGIYAFSLTGSGHIANFRRVKGGVIPGLARIFAAVSPDGSKVAIAGVPEAAAEGNTSALQPARIVVVNLRTGRRVVFQGGMDRRGQQFGINDVAWTNDGKSLVYLAQWCTQLDPQFVIGCDTGRSVTKLRMISAVGNGGSLNGGRTLLRDSRAHPLILQALASPDGRSLVVMTERGNEVRLVRFDLRTGRPIAVLYARHALNEQGIFPGLSNASLSSDGTGRYLILDEDLGALDGWIHDGRFHLMKTGLTNDTFAACPAW